MDKIIKGNKLIAEFMGYKIITPQMRKHPENWRNSYWENKSHKDITKQILCMEDNEKYHSSWNWLMPVVSKCLKEYPEMDEHSKLFQNINNALMDVNIEDTWESVIEFIKHIK